MNITLKYVLIIIVLIILIFIPYDFLFHSRISLCAFKIITNIECPLCGMTRASYEMLHLHLLSALHFNPVCVFLPLLLLIEIALDIYSTDKIRMIRKITFILFLISLGVIFAVRIYQFFAN